MENRQTTNRLTEAEADELQLLEYIRYHYRDGFDDTDRARYAELEARKAGA